MRYLIDTNVFAKLVVDNYISNDVRAILDDCENQIYISSESVKELIHLMQTERIVPKKSIRSRDLFDLIENEFALQVK